MLREGDEGYDPFDFNDDDDTEPGMYFHELNFEDCLGADPFF